MKKLGIGKIVKTRKECGGVLLSILDDDVVRQDLGRRNREFVESKAGAGERVVRGGDGLKGK